MPSDQINKFHKRLAQSGKSGSDLHAMHQASMEKAKQEAKSGVEGVDDLLKQGNMKEAAMVVSMEGMAVLSKMFQNSGGGATKEEIRGVVREELSQVLLGILSGIQTFASDVVVQAIKQPVMDVNILAGIMGNLHTSNTPAPQPVEESPFLTGNLATITPDTKGHAEAAPTATVEKTVIPPRVSESTIYDEDWKRNNTAGRWGEHAWGTEDEGIVADIVIKYLSQGRSIASACEWIHENKMPHRTVKSINARWTNRLSKEYTEQVEQAKERALLLPLRPTTQKGHTPWTTEEDRLVAHTVLQYISQGKTILAACREVEKSLPHRNAGSINTRWNNTLVRDRQAELEEAKLQGARARFNR